MKKYIAYFVAGSLSINSGFSQFNPSAENWTIPSLENSFAAEDQVQGTNYTVMDFNGDGLPDLIDAQNQATGVSWNDGSFSYWKVYLNNGDGFNSTAQNWTLPYLENSFAAEDQVQSTGYAVMDFDGDGRPDLIDAQDHTTAQCWFDGSFPYWKVYLNTGTGFNSVAENWTIPTLESSLAFQDQVQSDNYTVMDFNGDGLPDLIDAQDQTTASSWNDGSSSFWRVFINTGSGFAISAENWWLPYLENSFTLEDQVQGTGYSVIDFDGDGLPDLVDAQSHTTSECWFDGSSPYWKVYKNDGSSFSASASNWTLPILENSLAFQDQVQSDNYTVMDFNGDGRPELIDAQNQATSSSWNDGSFSYWKVYENLGTGFVSSAVNWTVPYLENSFASEDQVQGINYSVMDFNGDGSPDLIDAQDHTTGVSWNDGALTYWKVYLNEDVFSSVSIDEYETNSMEEIHAYPNPTNQWLTLEIEDEIDEILVLDIMGKEVMRLNKPSETIDLSSLANGSYVLQIVAPEQTYSTKIVKE